MRGRGRPGQVGRTSCFASRVPRQCCRLSAVLILIIFSATGAACARQDARLQQHREQFESLGETTAAICEAWLEGDVSGSYTHTALERTFMLVEQERTALAASPEALLDSRGAELSQAGEHLSRVIARLLHEVEGANDESVRRLMAQIPIRPPAGRP